MALQDERIRFLQSLGCVVASHTSYGGQCRGPVGEDAGVPLCERHQVTLRRDGVRTFEDVYDVSLARLADETDRAWRKTQMRLA